MDKCFDKPRKDVSLHPKLLREHTFILILAMKKNVYFLLALLLIGLSACDNAPKFKVQGEINGAEDKMLYLEASGLDGIVALDSAKLGSSGSFSFAQKRPESPEFYRLRLDNKVINFAVDSTETVSVKAEINDFATAYRIEGSENNLKIKELVLLQADLQKNVDKLGQNRNIPRGWQRTYPHMMSVEGVYGAEWYNNAPILTNRAAEHNATLPFTRNVVGPMDYTPGTFSNSQHPHITSYAHELALPVIFESALQHMPDRPSVYYSLPAPVKKLLSELPTAWDDTKLLGGYPGKEVIIARRKGEVWYIGGVNGTNEASTLHVPLDKIPVSGKKISLFKDGVDDNHFTIEENIPLTDEKNDLVIECLPRGGFAAVIK